MSFFSSSLDSLSFPVGKLEKSMRAVVPVLLLLLLLLLLQCGDNSTGHSRTPPPLTGEKSPVREGPIGDGGPPREHHPSTQDPFTNSRGVQA